jgi:hypothetical protein
MQWYIDLITITVTAFLLKLAAALISGPIRTACELRRESLTRITFFQHLQLPIPRELATTSREIHDYDQAVHKVRHAQHTFAYLGARFLMLSESEPTVRNLMTMIGLDIALAGYELTRLSQIYATAKIDNQETRDEIEKALQSTNVALKASRRFPRDGLIKIRLEPIRLRDSNSRSRERDRQLWQAYGGRPTSRHPPRRDSPRPRHDRGRVANFQ